MRSILVIALLLTSFGAIAAMVPSERVVDPSKTTATPPLKWVRTVDGWEKLASSQPTTRTDPPLHPAVVGSFIALASTTLLLAASRR